MNVNRLMVKGVVWNVVRLFLEWLLPAMLMIAPWIFIISESSLRFGMWYQTEAPSFAFMFMAGAVAIAIVIRLMLKDGFAQRSSLHLVVVLPFLVAVWAFVTSLFHQFSGRTLYGYPELGEGGFAYLSVALFSWGVLIVRPRLWQRRLVAFSAVGAIVANAYLLYVFKTERLPVVPYFYPDYLAHYAVYLPLIAGGLLFRRRRWQRVALVLSALLASYMMYISDNRGGMVIWFLGGPLLFLIVWRMMKFKQEQKARQLSAAGVVLAPVAMTIITILIGTELLSLYFKSVDETFLSRFNLINVGFDAIKGDLDSWLIGKGWGMYPELLTMNVPLEWVDLNNIGSSWDALNRIDFHSHNYVFDAFLGGGVIAVVLVTAMMVILPLLSLRRHLPMMAATGIMFSSLSALWFQMPVSWPVMAIAWSSMVNPRVGVIRWPKPSGIRVQVAVVALCGIVLLSLSWHARSFAIRAFPFMPAMKAEHNADAVMGRNCPELLEDFNRGDEHLLRRYNAVTGGITGPLKEARERGILDDQKFIKEISFHMDKLRGTLCAAENRILSGTSSVRLMMMTHSVMNDIASLQENPVFPELAELYLAKWEGRIRLILEEAPGRWDLWGHYLIWLLKEERVEEYDRIAMEIYETYPGTPVAQWFSGISLLNKPGQGEVGLDRMRRALEMGLERLIPVDLEIKEQVMAP
ncbi:MAG: O-antigen ligase family protein [Magnetococcales bacterium]|nr:O-antigen ligase family protein [Magnetococcales bacterium]